MQKPELKVEPDGHEGGDLHIRLLVSRVEPAGHETGPDSHATLLMCEPAIHDGD